MSTTHRSALWQGIIAGLTTFAVAMVPTIAILYLAGTGSMGSVSTARFGTVAAVVLGGIAIGAGHLVYRAYDIDAARRPGEVWSTWFTGFVVLVVGSWFVPFIVLFVFIDSDHALSDRPVPVYLVWTLATAAFAGLAWWMVRGLRRHPDTPDHVKHTDAARLST